MFTPKTPKLSWLLILLYFGYFRTFGMDSIINDAYMGRTYDIEELREEFPQILEAQPKFIYLDSTDSQYKSANGVYKLLPYYQKISPEKKLTLADSRFIIHKHVISGQWQLTESYAYPLSKIIKAFPVTEENEKNALLNSKNIKPFPVTEETEKNALLNTHRACYSNNFREAQILFLKIISNKSISNAMVEIQLKNEIISLKGQNGSLMREIAKQMHFQNELEYQLIQNELILLKKEKSFSVFCNTQHSKLIEKEKKIQFFYKIQTEWEAKVSEKENEIQNFYETQTELEAKVIERENKIQDFYKTQTELEAKVIERENKICDIYKHLIKREDQICAFSKKQMKLESKLIEKENEIRHRYKTQSQLESKLIEKENQIRDLKIEIQGYKKNKSEQNKTNQEKIKLIQIENRSELLNLKNTNLKEIEKKEENLQLIAKEKRIINQELSKCQKTNEQLELENGILKEKETFLKEMITNHVIRLRQLTAKLQNIEKTISETSPTNGLIKLSQSQHQETKTNLYKSESQIENIQEFVKSETISNENVETNTKEKLQNYESPIKTDPKFFKFKKHKNKTNLKNKNILEENPESVKLEKYECKKNGETEHILQQDDETKTKEKLTKHETQQIEKINQSFFRLGEHMKKFEKNLLEIVPNKKNLKEKTIKLSKEEKQMKRKIGKKQNKILNVIEQILFELVSSPNETEYSVKNEILTDTKDGYTALVSLLLQNLQDHGDENQTLKLKYCLENKNTLMANTDPNYEYESMFMHIGVIGYAKYMINELMKVDNSSIDDVNTTDLFTYMKILSMKHEQILNNMLESVRDKKIKIKVQCFKKNECLFDSHKYKYESYLRTIGIILYGFGNALEKEFIKSEKQILKNENILQENQKVFDPEEQNLENETNVEIKYFATPKELSHGTMKLKILDIIEHIFYKSRPLPKETKSSTLDKIITNIKIEHNSLVCTLLQNLLDNEDRQLTLDMESFLDNRNTLDTDPNYRYELMLMNLGAMSYNHNIIIELKPSFEHDYFATLTEDGKDELSKYASELQKRYKKHEKIVSDILESEDKKIKIQIKCFDEKVHLYGLPQYRYECFIWTIGKILCASEDPLAKL